MTLPLTEPKARSQTTRVILIVVIGLTVLCCVLVCLIGAGGLLIYRQPTSQGASQSVETPEAWIDLQVAFDGCHVQRSELQGDSGVSMLTWVISDLDGTVLLELSAEDEMIYRYSQSGTYRVHVKGWYASQYHTLSDEVLIECP